MQKDLSHNFINCITKANQPKMAYGFQTKLFWDEGNQGPIKVFRHFLCSKDFFDFKFHGLSHNQPKPLEESSLKSIQPRGFKCFHGL